MQMAQFSDGIGPGRRFVLMNRRIWR